MSTPHTPLTEQQAYTLAGAYADLVFGSFAPEFIDDIATAYLREDARQKRLAAETARGWIVRGTRLEEMLRQIGVDPTLAATHHAIVRPVRPQSNPSPKSVPHAVTCGALRVKPFPGLEFAARAYACIEPEGHDGTHTANPTSGLYYSWPQDNTTPEPEPEEPDYIGSYARCQFGLDEQRCTRRDGHDGLHEIVSGRAVTTWAHAIERIAKEVAEPEAKALEPGVIADKATGAEYWFNGKYLVPRSANGSEWGGGFAIGSHTGEQLGPFTQVFVLAPVAETSEGRA